MKAKDLLWDGDLVIVNGDFATGESDLQHIQDIVESSLGHWKEFPGVGVGAIRYLNGRDFGGLQSEALNQLAADGYVNNLVAEQLETGEYLIFGERSDG